MIITIDGPAASGKTTVSFSLAKKLSIYYIESGLFYRALAYLLVNKGHYTIPALSDIKTTDIQKYTHAYHYAYDENGAHIFYEGKDIAPFLKTKDMDLYTSLIGETPQVRIIIEDMIRMLAQKHDVIIDGRDTGSVIFPNADYKFYFTADLPIRAKRWQMDQARNGIIVNFAQAEKIVNERDERDEKRSAAPLCIPAGAHIIDTSRLTPEQTLNACLSFIKK